MPREKFGKMWVGRLFVGGQIYTYKIYACKLREFFLIHAIYMRLSNGFGGEIVFYLF